MAFSLSPDMDCQAYNHGVLVFEPSSDPPDVCSSEKKITLPLGTDQSTPTLERISKIGSGYFTTDTSISNKKNNKPKSNNTALDMISQLNNQVELILESIASQQDTAQSDITSNGTENGSNTSPAIKISIPILTNNKVDLNASNHFDNEDVVMVKSPEEANPVAIVCTTQNKEKMEVTLSDHNTIDEKNDPNNQDVAMLTFITLNGPSDESCMDESTIEQGNGKNHVDMDVTTLDMILQPRNKEDVDMLESNSNSMSITEKMDLADTSPVNKQDVIMQELSFSEKMDITSNYNIELYNQDMPMLEVPISGKIPGSLLCKIALPNTTLAKICKDTIKKEPPKCERVAQKRNSNHEIVTEPPFSKKEKLDERPEKPVPMQVCNNPNSFFLATFSMLNSMEEICGNEEIVTLCNESNDNKTNASKEVLLESVLAENSAQEYLWQCLECSKEPHCNKVVRGEEPNEVLVKTGPNNATVTKQNCTDKLKSNKQNLKQASGVIVAEENNNIETIQSKTGQENLVKSSTQNHNGTAKNIKSNTNTVKAKTNHTPPLSKQKCYTNSATVAGKNGVPKGGPHNAKSERLPLKQNQNCKVGEERTRTKSTRNNVAIVEDNSKTLSLKTGTCIKENNNLKTRVFSAGNEVRKKLPSKPYQGCNPSGARVKENVSTTKENKLENKTHSHQNHRVDSAITQETNRTRSPLIKPFSNELDKSNEPIIITQPSNTRDKINCVNKKNPVLENLKHAKISQESEKCCNSAESSFKVPCRCNKCQDVCSQDGPEECHFDKMFSGVDLFEDEDFLDDCSLLESGWHIPIHVKKERCGRPWHVPIQIKEEPVISLLTSSESEESDCSQSALGTDARTKKRKKKSHDSFPRKFVQKSAVAQQDEPKIHQTTGLSEPNLVRPVEGAKKGEAKREDEEGPVQKGQSEAEKKTLNNEFALLKRQKQEGAAGEKENMTFLELNGSDVVVHKSEAESLSNKKRKGQQVSSEYAKKLKVGTSEEVTRKSVHSTSGNKNTCSCENCRKQESSNKPKGNAELKHRGTNRFASSDVENGNVATRQEPKVINDQKETKMSEKKRDGNMKQKGCDKQKAEQEVINKQSKVGLEEHKKKHHNNKQSIKKKEQITRSKTEITNDQTKIGKSEDRNNQKIKQNIEPVKPNSIEEYRHVTLEKMDRVVRENKKKELERLLRKGSEEEILKMKIAEEENRQKDLQRKMELGRIQVEQIIEQVKKKEIERQRSLEENGFPPQLLRSFKTSGEENTVPSTILERRQKAVLKMDFEQKLEAQPNSVAEPPKVNQVQQFEVTDKNKSLLVYHCNECNKLHFSPRNDYRLVCQELGDVHVNNEPSMLEPVNVGEVQLRRRPVLRQRVRNIIEIESCFNPIGAIPEVVALTVQVRNNSGQVETLIYNLPRNRRLVPISPEDFEAARQSFLNRRRERIQGEHIDNDSPEGREYISRQHYRSGPYYFRPDDRVDRESAPNRQLVDIRFPNNMYSGSKTSIGTQTDERENSETESVDSCYYETENSQSVQSDTKSGGDKSESSGAEESDSDYDELTELRQQVERSMIRMKEMETQIAKYDLERRIAEYKMKQVQSCCGMSMADKELWERCKLYTNTIFCEKCQELRLKMLYKSRSKEAMKNKGASINDDAPQATQEEDVFSTPTDDYDEAETDSDSIQKQELPAEKQKERTEKKDDTTSEDSKRMPPPKILAATNSLLNNYQRQKLLQSIASLPTNAPALVAQSQSFGFQGTYLAPKIPSIPKQDFMGTYEKLMVPTIIAGVNNILHQQNVANNMNVKEMPQPSGNTNNNTPYPINYSRSDSDSEDEKYSRFYKLLKHYNKPRIGAWQDDSSDEATIVSKQLLQQLIDKTGTLTKTLSAIDFRKTIQKKNLNSIATQDTCNKLSNFQFSSVIIASGDSIGGNHSNMGILCQTGKKFNCSCLQTYSRCISPGKCYLNWSFSHNKITKHYEQSRNHATLQHVQMASNPVGMTFYEVYLLNVIRSIRNNSHLSISIPVINPSFCLNLSEVNINNMTIQLNQQDASNKNRQYKISFDDIVEYIRTYLNMSERMTGLEVGVLKKLRQICSPNILPQEITTLLQKLEFTYRSYQMAKENFLAGDNRALLPIFECMQFLLMGSSAGSR